MSARVVALAAKTVKIFAILAFAQSAAFAALYCAAVMYLERHDPRAHDSVTGVVVYAAPLSLSVGDPSDKQTIIRYLFDLGYRPGGDGAGTYDVGPQRLTIRPQAKEATQVTVRFENGRVAELSMPSGRAPSVDLESKPLTTWIFMNGKRAVVRRRVLPASDFTPSTLRDMIVWKEDRGFDDDEDGVRPVTMIWRALHGNGGSTLTCQYVKNAILRDSSRSAVRKAQEFFLSLAVAGRVPKDELIAGYANSIYLGDAGNGTAISGFGALIEELYGKSAPRDLTDGEAAVCAILINRPNHYLKQASDGDYGTIIEARNALLDSIGRGRPNIYPPERIAAAKVEPVRFLFKGRRAQDAGDTDDYSGYFLDYLYGEVQKTVPVNNLEGARIVSTLDIDLERAAGQAVSNGLARLRESPALRAIEARSPDDRLEAALVAIRPDTGEVVALVGGDGYALSPLDRAAISERSPGSLVKPWSNLAAITSGWHGTQPFTAATVVDGVHDRVDGYRPTRHLGPAARARVQLARSNGAAVVVAHDAGLDSAIALQAAAFASAPERTGMAGIGGARGCETTPLHVAEGYAALACGGLKPTATPIREVRRDGARVSVDRQTPARIADPAAVFIVADMLRNVLGFGGPDGRFGTAASVGRRLRGSIGPNSELFFAKTGTGQVSDCWIVVGVPGRLVVVVWVGFDGNSAMPMSLGLDGARVAGPIAAEFLEAVGRLHPEILRARTDMPAGITALTVDPRTGAPSRTGQREYFLTRRLVGMMAVSGLAEATASRRGQSLSGLSCSECALSAAAPVRAHLILFRRVKQLPHAVEVWTRS